MLLVGAAVATLPMQPAHGQTYPSKPIRFVVPFTPGGSNDVLARLIGQKLSDSLKQAVVVQNRPGAGGNIGAELVAKSAPDGYTFLIAANNIMAINPTLYKSLPFDPLNDFAPVTMLGTVPILLVVNSDLPARSVKDLIELARASPSGLTYASGGSGTPQHLSAELLKSMTGIKLTHVPYKGNAPAVTDLLAGQVQMLLSPINSVLPHVKSGKLRALAVGGTERLPYLPDVPTIAEAAVPGYNSDVWVALVAPAGTPKDVIERVNREIAVILQQADVRDALVAQGIEPMSMAPDRLAALIRSDLARWGRVVKDSGAQAE
ncbi:MAG: MFS transporter [Alphaproteobacteria bacterium]|nr:MAG: MFS transporter [Alphaproteobacteria bacterium]